MVKAIVVQCYSCSSLNTKECNTSHPDINRECIDCGARWENQERWVGMKAIEGSEVQLLLRCTECGETEVVDRDIDRLWHNWIKVKYSKHNSKVKWYCSQSCVHAYYNALYKKKGCKW